jgi:hypothetical protein
MSKYDADPTSMAVLNTVTAIMSIGVGYKLIDNHIQYAKQSEAADVRNFREQGFTNVVKEIGGLGVNYGDCKLVFTKEDDGTYSFKRFDTEQSTINDVTYARLAQADELAGCID